MVAPDFPGGWLRGSHRKRQRLWLHYESSFSHPDSPEPGPEPPAFSTLPSIPSLGGPHWPWAFWKGQGQIFRGSRQGSCHSGKSRADSYQDRTWDRKLLTRVQEEEKLVHGHGFGEKQLSAEDQGRKLPLCHSIVHPGSRSLTNRIQGRWFMEGQAGGYRTEGPSLATCPEAPRPALSSLLGTQASLSGEIQA